MLAYKALVRRAVLAMRWRIMNSMLYSPENIEQLMMLYMGAEKAKDKKAMPKRKQRKGIADMSKKELMKFYNSALKATGTTVDPEALAKAMQQT